MASSLLNRLKLRAGESVDTIDPNDPNDPNQAIIDRYKNVPGVNVEKLTEYVNLNLSEPQTIVDAMLLAEAIGYTPTQAKVVGAQWALESTRGTDTAGADYNYFGVKSHNEAVMKRMSEQYGIDVAEGAVVNTKEVYNGKTEVIQSTFASFKNPIEGFLGKKAFLETNKRYKDALKPENTADQFAAKLKAAGYATDPDYVKKISSIYNGPMRTVRPTWMQPTKKSTIPQLNWAMTGVQPTEGSRADLVAKKANQVVEQPDQAIEQPDVDEVLADIKYKPQIPRMPFGNNEEDIIQYSKDIDAYNDAVNRPSIDEAADQEMAAYEANPQGFDSYENYTKLEEVENNFQTNPNDFENTMTNEEYEALNISNPKNAVVDSDFNEDDYMDLPEVTVSAKKSVVGDYGPEVEADLSKYDNLEFLNNSSSPRSTISEGSFTNEARSKEQLKRDAAAQKFISDPLQQSAKPGYFGSGQSIFYPSRQNQQRSGGSLAPIIPEYYKSKGTPIYRDTTSLPFNYGGILENGGPGNGMFTALDTIDNLQKDYYQSMSPSKFQNLQLNVDETLKQYEKEKARTSGVQKNAFELAQKLANNTDVTGKQHYYNKARTEEVGGNAQDWEAIDMGFVNNPDSWIRNIKDSDMPEVLDDDGNMIPYTKDGYGCIGASCGIYAKAGATQKEDYGTGFGKKTIKAGEPIFKQTGNKFLDANNYAALKAKGFTQSDVADEGAIARVRYPDSPTTHSFIVGKKQNGEVQEFYENSGNLDSGIEKTGKKIFDYYKPNLTYWNYTGNTEDLNKKYKNLLAQKESYNRYNVPEKLKTRKAEFSQEPVKMPFVLKKQSYPNTRKGRKQEKQNNAYVEAYMNKLQKK
tara:strand:+ start:51 stop:2633 length:2583 start_codon:yes stop_codon:yes gene_type:complete